MAKTVLYRVLQEDGGELLDVSKYLKAGDNASLQLKLTVWPSDEDGFRNPAGMSGALILPWSKEFEETVLLIIFPEMPNIHDQPSALEVRSVILYGLNSVKRLSGMELVSTDSSHDSERAIGPRHAQSLVMDYYRSYMLLFSG